MKKQVLSALMVLLVGFGSLLQLSSYVHSNYDESSFPYISLVPPPPEALAAAFGVPLSTVDIGLFAYYKHSSWDLNDVIPAFQNHTQYSNYVDGYVRVHYAANGTNFESCIDDHSSSDPEYIDVQVRVRSDGWILAWLEDTQNKAFILHWGDYVKRNKDGGATLNYAFSSPSDYRTCLARAFHRVYHNAGVSWIGYDAVFYYDYEFPDATRLYVFGDSTQSVFPDASANSDEFYFIVPDTVTIEHAILAYAGHNSSGDDIDIDYVDRATIDWSPPTGWRELDITSYLSEGTRHLVELDNGGSGQGESIACGVVMWTS